MQDTANDHNSVVGNRLSRLAPPSLWGAGVSIASLHGLYVLWVGVMMSPDSSTYDYWSARLIESRFAYGDLLAEANAGFPPTLYVLFVTYLALVRLVTGEGWQVATIILNLAAHTALGLMVVRMANRTAGAVGGWVSLALFLGCYDLLQWTNFVLSDVTFVLLAFSIFALATRRILGDAIGWVKVGMLAVAGVFYRPTGIVLLPDLVWAFYLSRSRRNIRPDALIAVLALTAFIAAATVFLWLVQDPDRWPFEWLSSVFAMVGQGYASGEVVMGRLETYHQPPFGLPEFASLSCDRFFHFFAPGAAGHSPGHWLVSAAFLLPCYALAAWLIFAIWRDEGSYGDGIRKVFIAAAGAVLAYALFHALVQVDFDWRYRTPILPHLILLASAGAADLSRRRFAA